MMPSRKRNKGKERKAKKAEQEVERIENEKMVVRKRWQGRARGEDMRDLDNGSIITKCNHGCDLMIPHDNNHPVTSFMDEFFMKCYFAEGGMHVVQNLVDTFVTQLAVWNDDSHRKMTRNLMLRIGTNMIVDNNVDVLGVPRDIAYAVVVLENYDGSGDIGSTIYCRVVESKYRDLRCGGGSSIRDVLKIYRKRISCSCLKDKHLLARKATPKMGACCNCGKMKERVLLMVCSKCRISQYCSRECQIAAWSVHRGHCDIRVKAHQRRRQHGL